MIKKKKVIQDRATMAGDNRAGFAARLQQALAEAGYEAGPTLLCRVFNLHYCGTPITVHAARKWIVGESIPTHDKLQVLATVLGVAPEWLMYGREAGAANDAVLIEPQFARLLAQVRNLNEDRQRLVQRFVTMLSKEKEAA